VALVAIWANRAAFLAAAADRGFNVIATASSTAGRFRHMRSAGMSLTGSPVPGTSASRPRMTATLRPSAPIAASASLPTWCVGTSHKTRCGAVPSMTFSSKVRSSPLAALMNPSMASRAARDLPTPTPTTSAACSAGCAARAVPHRGRTAFFRARRAAERDDLSQSGDCHGWSRHDTRISFGSHGSRAGRAHDPSCAGRVRRRAELRISRHLAHW
jgi:hypothetical protein